MSEIAINGYIEEAKVCQDLNNPIIKGALSETLGNDYDECYRCRDGGKSDIKSKNNILKAQIKKCKKGQFQQLDRHNLNHVFEHIPTIKPASQILKDLFEYPLLPNETHVDKSLKLKKLNSLNYTPEELDNFFKILNNNVEHILKYAFLGQNEENQPDYVITVQCTKDNQRVAITAFKIQDAINYLKTLRFKVSPRKTVIYLGEDGIISLQRKGGDKEKKSSNNMQIKIKPCELIDKIPHSKHKL
jgi:hypothetical protein